MLVFCLILIFYDKRSTLILKVNKFIILQYCLVHILHSSSNRIFPHQCVTQKAIQVPDVFFHLFHHETFVFSPTKMSILYIKRTINIVYGYHNGVTTNGCFRQETMSVANLPNSHKLNLPPTQTGRYYNSPMPYFETA